MKFAAALILITVLGIAFIILNGEEAVVYKTAYNQSKEIILPDFSRIILNANSTIKFKQRWNKREVWIDGEAYFSVQHLENNKKFVVHSNIGIFLTTQKRS